MRRYQHALIAVLFLNYILFGIMFFNTQSPVLRIFQQVLTFTLLALWLVSRWRRGHSLPRTALDRPLAALMAAWIIAAVTSLDPRVSLEYTWPILVAILGFYVLVSLFRGRREQWLMEALFLTGAVVVLISLLEQLAWYTGTSLWFGFNQGWPAINGLTLPPTRYRLLFMLNGTNGLGNFAATLTPLAIAWATTTRKRDLGVGAGLLAAGLISVVYFSGSRGALMGLLASSAILLGTEIRTRLDRPGLPGWLSTLLQPRVVFSLAAVVGMVLASAILVYTLSRPLDSGDANRIDLWRSALEMLRDHPLTGVGPFQFGHAQRLYGDPGVAPSQARHTHAHNLILQTLAEGGLIVGVAAGWLVLAYLNAWWKAWQVASPMRRRRLEGGLAALVGFAAHNMVDTFTQLFLLVPLLLIAAYTVYPTASPGTQPASQPRRRFALALAGLLIGLEILFIPIHLADLAHARFRRSLGQGEIQTALEEIQTARRFDPWLGLYPISEAHALALLAGDSPTEGLDTAITAHERSLARYPIWAQGWHNLAALHARTGQLDAAIQAQQRAVDLSSRQAGYLLKLGEYYELAGDLEAAQAACTRAIESKPELLQSGYWTDPANPARSQMRDAIIQILLEDPEIGLEIAVYAPNPEAALALVETIDTEAASTAELLLLGEWAINAGSELAPCPECYFLAVFDRGGHAGLNYTRLAEFALDDPAINEHTGYSTEQLARIALFMGGENAPRARYVLARLAERDNQPADIINQYLAQAVPGVALKQEFSTVVFGRGAALGLLPDAMYPVLFPHQYAPWLRLAERYAAAGDTAKQANVYRAILAGDPYQWEIRERLAALPEAG
ncbi:MAG: O-antigen ligase family protein [Anaerolineae bacterium]|nr:O-antigen ligase family protein [Anaerolineae bacterium]